LLLHRNRRNDEHDPALRALALLPHLRLVTLQQVLLRAQELKHHSPIPRIA
jgi:hypothetical protein